MKLDAYILEWQNIIYTEDIRSSFIYGHEIASCVCLYATNMIDLYWKPNMTFSSVQSFLWLVLTELSEGVCHMKETM